MIEVGALDDFPPRSVTVVPAAGVEIGIVRWDDDAVYALQNVCPHALGPVCAGRLGPKIVAAAGDPMALDVDETCPVIACAWHGWEFDVRSGQAIWPDGRMRVKTYATRIEDGRVLVAVDRTGGRGAADRPESRRVREVEATLDQLVRWAGRREDVRALALVGSWASGAPREDSDVDVVLLTDTPAAYIERDDWLAEVGAARLVRTVDWGAITERRFARPSGLEVELGVGSPAWASLDPLDAGTRRVASDGMRILDDRDGLLAALAAALPSPPVPDPMRR